MIGTKKGYKGVWRIEHRDRNGRLLWSEDKENALTNQGENNILNVYFRNLGAPATGFFVGMCNGSMDVGSTLATVPNEPVGNGYARQAVLRDESDSGWPVIELHEGNYRAISKQVQFMAAGGTIGPVNIIFLCTVITGISGLLTAFVNLSLPRTLLDGDSLLARYTVTLQ